MSNKSKIKKKTRRKRNTPEHDSQVLVFDWAWSRRDRYGVLKNGSATEEGFHQAERLYANNNGVPKYGSALNYFKDEGLMAGVPDITLALMRMGYGGLFIEMKSDVGVLNNDQKDMLSFLYNEGYFTSVQRSADTCIALIKMYILGIREGSEAFLWIP